MLDEDTFLTVLYVMSDDFCKEYLPLQARRLYCTPKTGHFLSDS